MLKTALQLQKREMLGLMRDSQGCLGLFRLHLGFYLLAHGGLSAFLPEKRAIAHAHQSSHRFRLGFQGAVGLRRASRYGRIQNIYGDDAGKQNIITL